MKTKIFTILVLAATLLAACKKDDFTDDERAASELSLTVVDGGYASSEDTESSNTESNNTQSVSSESSNAESSYQRTFIAGDKIGLYAVKDDAVLATANNLCLTLTDMGGGKLEWQAPSNAPISKLADRFFIYYPYQETLTGTVVPTATDADEFFANVITSWTPARDQSDYATGYSASDLMVGMGTPGTTVGSNGKCPLDITFAHKMGLVTLSKPSDVTAVEFKNFKPYNVDGVYHYLLKPVTQTLLEGIFTRNGQAQPYNFDAVVGAGSYLSYNVYQLSQARMAFYISGSSFTIPFLRLGTTGDYDLTIQWGDGRMKMIKRGTSLSVPISYKYSKSGKYIVSIYSTQTDDTKPQIPILGFGASGDKLLTMETPMLNTGATSFADTFFNCENLMRVPADLFARNRQITDFTRCFSGCTTLKEIPVGLFDNNPKATKFEECFKGCAALTTIPSGLFLKSPEVSTFQGCFAGCTGLEMPPWGLFANNPKVITFENCFGGCTGIKMLPADLFTKNPEVSTFDKCFAGCTALAMIPEGLFNRNPVVNFFDYCFEGCTALTAIPEGLFANNPLVYWFQLTFSKCSGLTAIPAGLFANNPLVTHFTTCFSGCTGLTAIPEGLFANNPKTVTFENCFDGCTGLTAIPENLFAKNPAVNDFSDCFSECTGLTAIPAGLFAKNLEASVFTNCFSKCSALKEVPKGLFDNNPRVYEFTYCFAHCTALTTIPEGLFAKNPRTTDFSFCFYDCKMLSLHPNIFCNEATEMETHFAGKTLVFRRTFYKCGSSLAPNTGGTAPALWDYSQVFVNYFQMQECFYGVTSVTNVDKINYHWR